MHRIRLTYSLGNDRTPDDDLHHPLLHLLEAIHRSGSISAAAREVNLSYRHVWGELKRWEQELGQSLLVWSKGQRAQLAPFGEKLLWAERRARARLAPQVEALRSELERAFAVAFDAEAGVLSVYASHDAALPRLREMAIAQHKLHLEIQFMGSVDALAALNEGRCVVAGFHALVQTPPSSPTARVYRPMFKPGHHKLIGFAERTQGLILPAGNPLGIQGLADLARPGLRFTNRQRGTGTRVVLEQLLASTGLEPSAIATWEQAEPSHEAVAEAVASGSADVAFGIEAAARRRGLDFIELAREQYFLVTLRSHLEQPEVLKLRALLRSAAWQQVLASLPGYAPARSGEVLSLRQVLPWWTWRKPKR